MADTAITAAIAGADPRSRFRIIWVSETEAFLIYAATTTTIAFRRSTNGGLTWSGATTIISGISSGFRWDCWYDRWTRGLATSDVWIVVAHAEVWFVRFDVGTQVADAPKIVLAPIVDFKRAAITRSRTGDIVAWTFDAVQSGGQRTFRSTDGGATFPEIADPIAAVDSADVPLLLVPANTSGGVWALYPKTSGGLIGLAEFSFSSWLRTSLPSAQGFGNTALLSVGTRFSDDHVFLLASPDPASAVETWEITSFAVQTARAAFLGGGVRSHAMLVSQVANVMLGAYSSPIDQRIRFKVSDNGGASWTQIETGEGQKFSEDADSSYTVVDVGVSLPAAGGRFQPVWWRDSDDMIMTRNAWGFDLMPWKVRSSALGGPALTSVNCQTGQPVAGEQQAV